MDEGLRITVGNEIYFERSGLRDELHDDDKDTGDLRNQLRATARLHQQSRTSELTRNEDYYDELYESLLTENLQQNYVDRSLVYEDKSFQNERLIPRGTRQKMDIDLDNDYAPKSSFMDERSYSRGLYKLADSSFESRLSELNEGYKQHSQLRSSPSQHAISSTEELSNRLRLHYGLSVDDKGFGLHYDDELNESLRDWSTSRSSRISHSPIPINSALDTHSGSKISFADADLDDAYLYERYATKLLPGQFSKRQEHSMLRKSLPVMTKLPSFMKDMPPPMPKSYNSDSHGGVSSNYGSEVLGRSSSITFDHTQKPSNRRSCGLNSNQQKFVKHSFAASNTGIDTGTYSQLKQPANRSRRRKRGRAKFIYVKPDNPNLKAMAEKYEYATSAEASSKTSFFSIRDSAIAKSLNAETPRSSSLAETSKISSKSSEISIDSTSFNSRTVARNSPKVVPDFSRSKANLTVKTQSLKKSHRNLSEKKNSIKQLQTEPFSKKYDSHKADEKEQLIKSSSQKTDTNKTCLKAQKDQTNPNLNKCKAFDYEQEQHVKFSQEKNATQSYFNAVREQHAKPPSHTEELDKNSVVSNAGKVELTKVLPLERTVDNSSSDVNKELPTSKHDLNKAVYSDLEKNQETKPIAREGNVDKRPIVVKNDLQPTPPVQQIDSDFSCFVAETKHQSTDQKTDPEKSVLDAEVESSSFVQERDLDVGSKTEEEKRCKSIVKNEANETSDHVRTRKHTRSTAKIQKDLDQSSSDTKTQLEKNPTSQKDKGQNLILDSSKIEEKSSKKGKTSKPKTLKDTVKPRSSSNQKNLKEKLVENVLSHQGIADIIPLSVNTTTKKVVLENQPEPVTEQSQNSLNQDEKHHTTTVAGIKASKSADQLITESVQSKPTDVFLSKISEETDTPMEIESFSPEKKDKGKNLPVKKHTEAIEDHKVADKTKLLSDVCKDANRIDSVFKIPDSSSSVVTPQADDDPKHTVVASLSQSIQTVIHQSIQTKASASLHAYKPINSIVSKSVPLPNSFYAKSAEKLPVSIPSASPQRSFSKQPNLKPVSQTTSSSLKVIPTISALSVVDSKGSNPSNLVSIRVETEDECRAKRLDHLEKEMEKIKKQQVNMWMKKQKQEQNTQEPPKPPETAKKPPEAPFQPPPKKEPPKPVVYNYFDDGDHFCSVCCRESSTMLEHVCHLHTVKHTQMVDSNHKPWLKGLKPLPKINAEKSLPVGGLEFLLPVTGFYCELCDSTTPDASAAVMHCCSQEHNKKFAEFCKKDPHYQVSRKNLVKQIKASCTIAQSLGLPLTKKNVHVEEPTSASRIKISLPTLSRHPEPQLFPSAVPADVGNVPSRKRDATSSTSDFTPAKRQKTGSRDKNVSAETSRLQPKPIENKSSASEIQNVSQRSVKESKKEALGKQSIQQATKSTSAIGKVVKEAVEIPESAFSKQSAKLSQKRVLKETSLASAFPSVESTMSLTPESLKTGSRSEKSVLSVDVPAPPKKEKLENRRDIRIPGFSSSDDEDKFDESSNVPAESLTAAANLSSSGDQENSLETTSKRKFPAAENAHSSKSQTAHIADETLGETKSVKKEAKAVATHSIDVREGVDFVPADRKRYGSEKSTAMLKIRTERPKLVGRKGSPAPKKSNDILKKIRMENESLKSGDMKNKAVHSDSSFEADRSLSRPVVGPAGSPSSTKVTKTKKPDNLFDFTTALVSGTYEGPSGSSQEFDDSNEHMEVNSSDAVHEEKHAKVSEKLASLNPRKCSPVTDLPKNSVTKKNIQVCEKDRGSTPLIVKKNSDINSNSEKQKFETTDESNVEKCSEGDNLFEKFTLEGSNATEKEVSKPTPIQKSSSEHKSDPTANATAMSNSTDNGPDNETSRSKDLNQLPVTLDAPMARSKLVPKEPSLHIDITPIGDSPKSLSNVKKVESRKPFVSVSSGSHTVPETVLTVSGSDSKPSANPLNVPINAILARRTAPTRSLRSNVKTFDALPIEKSPEVTKPAREKIQKAKKSIRPSRNTRSSIGVLKKKVNEAEPPPPGTEDDV